ncbi:MAG: hypothetical protein DMG39_27090 [Acidobacteria bacterium]|nr:MAG: hypothetical protein DMG39_27090 [Acidobacteriota bacterium]
MTRGRVLVKYVLSLCVGLLVGTFAYGQSNTGGIQGTITDPSGAIVLKAMVTGRNMDTGVVSSTVSTDAGLYSLPGLSPGRYAITVEAPGLKKYIREGVTVPTGTLVSLDVQMQVGAASENVTVVGDAAQLETATSDLGSTVQTSLVSNLPLEVSGTIRNPVQFITLTPGFVGGSTAARKAELTCSSTACRSPWFHRTLSGTRGFLRMPCRSSKYYRAIFHRNLVNPATGL